MYMCQYLSFFVVANLASVSMPMIISTLLVSNWVFEPLMDILLDYLAKKRFNSFFSSFFAMLCCQNCLGFCMVPNKHMLEVECKA